MLHKTQMVNNNGNFRCIKTQITNNNGSVYYTKHE